MWSLKLTNFIVSNHNAVEQPIPVGMMKVPIFYVTNYLFLLSLSFNYFIVRDRVIVPDEITTSVSLTYQLPKHKEYSRPNLQ